MVFEYAQYKNWFSRENASVVLLLKGEKRVILETFFLKEIITIISNKLGSIP